jgi:hypothetical protein
LASKHPFVSISGTRLELAAQDSDAEPAESLPGSVSHLVEGPSDVTAVIELFDRRYRDLRGEDDAYSSDDA